MPTHFTEFKQVKHDGTDMFEKDLYELSELLGRPTPEFHGAYVNNDGDGNLGVMIQSSIRGRTQPPTSRDLVYTTMDSSWADGLVRAMQRLLARLCEEHKEELALTRFRYHGRRNDDGNPTFAASHPLLGDHLTDMEVLLHSTQESLTSSRLQVHFQRQSLTEGRVRETQLKWENDHLRLRIGRQRRAIRRLRKRVTEQDEAIADLERMMSEIEEEGEDLRKENNAFISDDDDYLEEMDYEEEDDDEEMVDEEEEPEAVLDDEEEDPEEPPYDSDGEA